MGAYSIIGVVLTAIFTLYVLIGSGLLKELVKAIKDVFSGDDSDGDDSSSEG